MSIEHAPRLVILGPATSGQREVELVGTDVLVGRSDDSQLYLDEPHVSRSHAVIRRRGDQYVVEDLHSSGGTKVNGVPARDDVPLRDGDVITFATVAVRFETGAGPDATQMMPNAVPVQRPQDVTYHVGDQHGRVISNVGRDQYNAYVQQVRQERESFLREVARTKSKARVLAWLGPVLMIVGFVVYAWVILSFIQRVPTLDPSSAPELFGPEVGGVPVGLLGFGAAMIGSILLTVGVILHIVAAARRRRTDRELPLPPPYEQIHWSDR